MIKEVKLWRKKKQEDKEVMRIVVAEIMPKHSPDQVHAYKWWKVAAVVEI